MHKSTAFLLKLSLLISLSLCQSWSAENRRPVENRSWGLPGLPSLSLWASKPQTKTPMPSISSGRLLAKSTGRNDNQVTISEVPLKTLQDRINALGVPKPPMFLPLAKEKDQELIDKAKSGDEEALQTLLERFYWRAMKNPLTIEDVLKIPNIEEKALFPEGYLYWFLLRACKGIDKISGLADKIKSYAVTYNFAPAQHFCGLMCADNLSNEQIKFYELAAEQKYAPAQFRLGEIYEKGLNGDFIDERKAEEFYEKSAKQNYLAGMNSYVIFQHKKNNVIYSYYFFHSCWAFTDDSYYASTPISGLTKCFLIYKSTKYDAELLKINQGIHFQEMTKVSSKLSSKLTDWNFQELSQLPQEIFDISSSLEKSINMISETITLLGAIEPGFLVDCIDYGRFGVSYGFMTGKFLLQNPTKEYIVIGKQNNTLLDKVWEWYDLHNSACSALKPLYLDHEKKVRKLQDKLAHYKAIKVALEQLRAPDSEISSAEGDLIPHRLVEVNLDIHLYEKMILNYAPTFNAVLVLKEGMDQIGKAFQKYVEDGVHQRNKDFMAVYDYR